MESVSTELSQYLSYVQGNMVTLILTALGVLVWLWSGCFASSLAENRLRSPLFHFLGGLIIPIIYPLIVLFAVPVKLDEEEKREIEEEEIEKAEGPPPVELPPAADDEQGTISEEALGADVAYNQAYFKEIAIDMSGEYRGPFLLMVQGEELRIDRIVDALPAVVVTESSSADGKVQRLRVPYDNIDSCTEI